MNYSKHEMSEVNISVFYNDKQWPDLLTNAINPFIHNNFHQLGLQFYAIHFNDKRGLSITTSFKGSKDAVRKISQRADVHFSDFLSSNPSEDQPMHFPAEGLFINFPNNCIRFNVLNTNAILINTVSEHRLSRLIENHVQKFSLLLPKIVEEDTNYILGSRFFLAIQLHLLLIYALYSTTVDARSCTNSFYKYIDRFSEDHKARMLKDVNRVYEIYREELVDHCANIWSAPSVEVNSEEAWQQDWLEISNQTIAALKEHNIEPLVIEENTTTLIHSLNHQLNIKKGVSILLLISKVLEDLK